MRRRRLQFVVQAATPPSPFIIASKPFFDDDRTPWRPWKP